MEVAHSAPQILSEPPRRGTPLPLSQLVEESRSRANIPNHPLYSKTYATLKSNGLIQAEPPVLHFNGFKLGKDYIKILKLINISSEAMNIHIIPTQTKNFQTTYTKKYRLIPGLAYMLKVRFSPDEWRYFYDCVRVHCKGEENLLIPVHAYPVIDDLHIPPHIDLSAVPLGQSVCHAIPLRCSCPIDFEYQVYVIQPHEAFSIHPLTGVIPANGEVSVTVTFTPFRYETSQVIIQLIISQFNSKPYLCTITGSSSPHLALSEVEENGDSVPAECKGPSPAAQVPPLPKTKSTTTKEADKSKTLTPEATKILVKDISKVNCKGGSKSHCRADGLQNRRMKEGIVRKKVQQNVKMEEANHCRQNVSEDAQRQIREERETVLREYMVKRGDVRQEEDFAAGPRKLTSRRALSEAGQACEGAPSSSFHRRRALALFQQAARKVVTRCRTNRRPTCSNKVSDGLKKSPSAKTAEEETTCDLKISPDRIFPFAFPIFSDEDDPLALANLVPVPVEPIDVTVTARVPLFKLQVPQHYKIMGYQPVSAWEAFNSYIPTTLARPLRSGALDELGVGAQSPTRQQCENEEEEAKEAVSLTFSAPETLLKPFPANPLRIFNPAPGLQAYKPTPKYLESDLEFHLCPLPRYKIPESSMCGIRTRTPHNQKPFLDHTEVIPGLMTWNNLDSITSNCLSKQPVLTSDCVLRRSVDYSTDTLPLAAPPPLTGPPDDVPPPPDEPCEALGVQLTPEMIRAEFLSGEAVVSNSNLAVRHQRELQMEATCRSEFNQMGKRVMTRLKRLAVTDATSLSPGDGCE